MPPVIDPGAELNNQESTYQNINIENCSLAHKTFTGKRFINCLFINCNFSYVRFKNCQFQGMIFFHCQLDKADLTDSNTFRETSIIKSTVNHMKVTLKDAEYHIYLEDCYHTEDMQIMSSVKDSFYNLVQDFHVIESHSGGQAKKVFVVQPLFDSNHYFKNRVYVAKILTAENKKDKKRILRACDNLKKVRSPYVVELKEARELLASDGKHYDVCIIMEYARGCPIGRFSKHRHALTAEEKKQIFWQAFKGLEEIERKGIVHRDLTPNNIIIRPLGNDRIITKIIDFGFSKIFKSNSLNTTKIFVWPGYHPPEMYKEIKPSYNHRSDQFSLATTLYEMWTGKHPFVKNRSQCLNYSHYLDEISKERSIDYRSIELPYRDILKKALSLKPESRYRNIEEITRQLS